LALLFYGAINLWLIAAVSWGIVIHGGAKKLPPIAGALEALGLALWTMALVAYTQSGGVVQWPLTTPQEFLLAVVWSTVLIHLAVEFTEGATGAGYPAPVMATVLALLSGRTLTSEPFPTPAAFRSIWFQLHTATAALAYGSLGVACAIAIVRVLGGDVHDEGPGISKALRVGYICLTLSMLTGAIWGQLTWGSYWSWSLKEVWTFIVWLLYTLYFHIKPLPRWRGRAAAILLIVAFGVVLFTLLGTEWLARRISLEARYVF